MCSFFDSLFKIKSTMSYDLHCLSIFVYDICQAVNVYKSTKQNIFDWKKKYLYILIVYKVLCIHICTLIWCKYIFVKTSQFLKQILKKTLIFQGVKIVLPLK